MTTKPTAGRARRLAVFAIIAAAQFVLFEAGLRTWGSSEAAPSFQGLFMEDPVVGYRLQPNARVQFTTSEFDAHIAINSAGVRDNEELGVKAPNERRIVILGDSIVLSVQVPFEQTFGELLEARLNRGQSTYRYRVINAGVQGYGPIQEMLFFRTLAPQLQPDITLTTVFVGNDAEDAYAARAAVDGVPPTPVQAATEEAIVRLRRLVRRSMVLQILRVRVLAVTDRLAPRGAPPEPPLQSYAANPAPRIQEGLDLTREAVRRIATLSAGLGARTGIVLMPARFQVDDADYGRLDAAVEQSGGELIRDGASMRFAEVMGTLPYPVLDVLPAMRKALPGPDLWYKTTVHLTPRGHEVVAAALDEFLRTSGLLDAAGAGS